MALSATPKIVSRKVFNEDYTAFCRSNTSHRVPPTDELPIRDDIDYIVSAGNLTDAAFRECCAPYAVNVIQNCYIWCQLPSKYLQGSGTSDKENWALRQFLRCAQREGRNQSGVYSVNVEKSGSSRALVGGDKPRLLGAAMVALLVSGLLCSVA
ncbi:uncharacterized protein E0L32_007889 [Thyridium curvatum]|uniref:Uncharacterized protein n=1 Tax=Thyridium curvatum TaxID=1093900 RepID=A0A507B4D9_9PEZI|nr:uncharacterized protein E0L32_007889 [Thyridium curvatum]TPX11470.1 hypothetical protein E0L32_007889 [Thyridium curvatum]